MFRARMEIAVEAGFDQIHGDVPTSRKKSWSADRGWSYLVKEQQLSTDAMG